MRRVAVPYAVVTLAVVALLAYVGVHRIDSIPLPVPHHPHAEGIHCAVILKGSTRTGQGIDDEHWEGTFRFCMTLPNVVLVEFRVAGLIETGER